MRTTKILVSDETWKSLNQRKEPGESFDDVIRRLMADANGVKQT